MTLLVAPLVLLASCGSSDGAATKEAKESKAVPAVAKPSPPPMAESTVTVATPAKMDRRKYPNTYTNAELLAKGAVVVRGEDLRQLLRGAEITPKKGTNPGPPWNYRFGCDETGTFTSSGDSISNEQFEVKIVDHTAYLSFTYRPNKYELRIIKLGERYFRFFVSEGRDIAVEINLRSSIKC